MTTDRRVRVSLRLSTGREMEDGTPSPMDVARRLIALRDHPCGDPAFVAAYLRHE